MKIISYVFAISLLVARINSVPTVVEFNDENLAKNYADKIEKKVQDISWSGTSVETNTKVETITEPLYFLKNMRWGKVKQQYLNNVSAMKKFLQLRIQTTIYIAKEVLAFSSGEFSACSPDTFKTFTGDIKKFSTGCISATIQSNMAKKGTIQFDAGAGSQNVGSDIDFNIDFIPDQGVTVNDYQRLYIVGMFIKNFDILFQEKHGLPSGDVYDVNLYSKNFASQGYVDLINSIYSSSAKKVIFQNANRLSVTLLAWNDAYLKWKKYVKSLPSTFPARPNDAIDNLKKNSEKETSSSNYACSDFLFKDSVNKVSKINQPRDENLNMRVKTMVFYLKYAAGQTGDSDALYRACNLLAANYYAPEAYVAYGSIWEMLTLYDLMNVDSFGANSKKRVLNLNQNELTDGLIMNFAYMVEHYVDAIQIDKNEKFSKYNSRLYRISMMLSDTNAKDCWKGLFTSLWGSDKHSAYANISDKEKQAARNILKAMRDDTKDMIDENKIKSFVEGGYNCINKYHLTILSERKRKLK